MNEIPQQMVPQPSPKPRTKKTKVPEKRRLDWSAASSRTGLTAADIRQSFLEHLGCSLGRSLTTGTPYDFYTALAYTVRDRLLYHGAKTIEHVQDKDSRVVAYLSAEFLPGPHSENNMRALGIDREVREALSDLGLDTDKVLDQEEEPGLGNGGLGRLASCFMDSLAALEVPAIGYGLNYEFGIFDQAIRDGWQLEITDKWRRFGNPWELLRSEINYEVKFGGRVETWKDEQGRERKRWIPGSAVRGIACDTPIPGHAVKSCTALRLWKAEAIESFDLSAFGHGDYYRAVEDKVFSENITKILYPNDEHAQGKALRLQQQFFFVSCALQDMLRIHLSLGRSIQTFHEKWAVQLNDTHPAVAIAEMMRLLIDDHLLDWDQAWAITQKTFCYTNHTLLPEALEKWSIQLFGGLLPRHLEIIYGINERVLDEVRRAFPNDLPRVVRTSLIEEGPQRSIRMAHLAAAGSHYVNGVSALHSQLLKTSVLKDFAALWPERFENVTNGVNHRRFLLGANPRLSELISDKIGDSWIKDLSRLSALEKFADDLAFQAEWHKTKIAAKQDLAGLIQDRCGQMVYPDSLFSVQAKRIHEYKRQHLNALHILSLYLRFKRDPHADIPARTFIFSGKAAPGYFMAKLIIKLIHALAALINEDPIVKGRLKVLFFPDFNVKNAQRIYPAADISEQISTAGKEASGTGNMKFAMNGAITAGTLDGANIELREAIGKENFFAFGMSVPQVQEVIGKGYRPHEYYRNNRALREVIDYISSGALAGGNTGVFKPLVDNLLGSDPFLVLADYQSYVDCQARIHELWKDRRAWAKTSILNVARSGNFTSDRSIKEYRRRIWNL